MIITADARHLPICDDVVNCVVTSPPYWGLRNYADNPNQIGLEPTPEAYVANIVAVFREVWRVLRDDGTVWLNLGDCYAGSNQTGGTNSKETGRRQERMIASRNTGFVPSGLKPKDLIGIPWRVALALQADGWYLRSDIIWAKPNPMPESVTDRPTRSHEYIFLLTKAERYYYDAKAIAEPALNTPGGRLTGSKHGPVAVGSAQSGTTIDKPGLVETRNKRSVWTIPTSPYSGAHFATFPERLVEPCILAGCPMGGLVFDPFIGSGTVGAVAERTGRRWAGTDLSYQDLSQARTAQQGLKWG